jgi:translation initiation factor IF-2
MPEVEVGIVQHYFDKAGVGAIEITDGELAVGDTIHIKGSTTDFTATVESIQIEHQTVEKAKKGDDIGIKLSDKVRQKDKVFKVT